MFLGSVATFVPGPLLSRTIRGTNEVIVKELLRFARPHVKWIVSGIVVLIVGVVSSMAPPTLAKIVVDDVLIPAARSGDFIDRSGFLLVLILGMAGATAMRAGAIYFKNIILEIFSQRVVRDIKQSLYDHIQSLSFDFFHHTRTGELMARMTSDMEAIRVISATGVINGATGIFYLTISSIILLSINWRLALLSISVSPLIFFITLLLRRRITPKFRTIREQFSNLNAAVQENISGIRVVKSLMRYEFELSKFRIENEELTATKNSALVVWARYMPLIEFLSRLSSVILLFAGGWMVIRDQITLGTWVQFNGYLWMLVFPMQMLGQVVNNYALAAASAERAVELMNRRPNIETDKNPRKIQKMHGTVEFRGVYWSSDGQPILNGIDLVVEAGTSVAIMGATGSGKSSLVHLIPRFYDPDNGTVLIDGIDVRDLDVAFLRTNIGLVEQETFLFSETIYNNITYGRRSASPAFVRQVAQQTQAHMFIDSMTDGYGTVVGERGIGLSGGQKQRASIARTLLKQAPILILDDATSSVDMETEALIQSALRDTNKSATKIIIAHRISSVRHADEIVMLDHGRILERGTHTELMGRGGAYSEIFSIQHIDSAADRR